MCVPHYNNNKKVQIASSVKSPQNEIIYLTEIYVHTYIYLYSVYLYTYNIHIIRKYMLVVSIIILYTIYTQCTHT